MKYFLVSIIFLMVSIVSHAQMQAPSLMQAPAIPDIPYGGSLTLNSNLNTGSDSRLITNIYELAFWYRSNNATVYSNIEDGQVELKEVSIDFNFIGLGWKVGKVIMPFGFDYLERGTNSVFITSPRSTFYNYGLNLWVGDNVLNVNGSINEDNDYTFRANIEPIKDGLIFSTSYANHQEINDNFGEWSLTGKFLYSSLLLNFSVVTEYLPDIGGYWIRSVTSPGIFDFVGLMGAYYSLGNIAHGIDSYTYKPAWTYGLYMDVSKDVTLSTEWQVGEKFPSPYNIKIATNLSF